MPFFRTFLLGAARIATVVILVVVALSAIGWGVYEALEYRERTKNAALAEPKKWQTLKIEPLGGAQLNLSTIWREGEFYYQFRVDDLPPGIEAGGDGDDKWTLTFLDQNGFKVFDHTEPLSGMTKVVDAEGKPVGLSSNDSTNVSAENYRRASRWEATWNFRVADKNPPSLPQNGTPGWRPPQQDRPVTPKWRNKSAWRTLENGFSKAQVEQILGSPGKVDENAVLGSYWYYNDILGGQVHFDKSGKLVEWTEP